MSDFDDFEDSIDDVEDVTIDEGHGDVDNTAEDNSVGIYNPSDDDLTVSDDDVTSLEEKASGVDRAEADKSQISFGRKMCPTRHGCQGATDCDYSYGGYPG